MDFLKDRWPLAFVVCLVIFIGQGIYLVTWHTQVIDEAYHVSAGKLFGETGVFEGGYNNPPLFQLLLGLPYSSGISSFDPVSAEKPIAARFVNLCFGFFLCLVVALFCYQIYGKSGALLSLSLVCLSPSLIAHSSIATLDIAVALFSALGFLCLYIGQREEGIRFNLLGSLCFGLALVSKYTALLFFPYVIVLVVSAFWIHQRNLRLVLSELFLGAIIIWLCFSAAFKFEGCFTSKVAPGSGFLTKTIAWSLPKVGAETLVTKLDRARGSKATVQFFGSIRESSPPVYASIVIVKLLPGTLCFLLWFAICALKRESELKTWLYTLFPAIIFWSLLLINNMYCGIRHLLPCLTLLFVGLGWIGQSVSKKQQLYLIYILVVINVVSSIFSFPHQMSYFNFVGRSLTSGPFVIGYCDTDYCQEDDIEAELRTLPEDEKIWICPTPTEIPRTGFVAICCVALDRPAYRWLRTFSPMKRLGSTWLLYNVKEADFKKQALSSKSWPKVRIYLDYLLSTRQYSQVFIEAKRFSAEYKDAFPYIMKALIFANKIEECLRIRIPKEYSRWHFIALELLGRGRGEQKEQLARALHSLKDICSYQSQEYRDSRLHLLYVPGSKPSMNPAIRLYVGQHLLSMNRFEEALAHLEVFTHDRAVKEQVAVCRALLDISKAEAPNKAMLFQIMKKAPQFTHSAPQAIVSQLRRVHRLYPTSYKAIVYHHYLRGIRRHGYIAGDLGFETVLDKTNREGLYLRSSS